MGKLDEMHWTEQEAITPMYLVGDEATEEFIAGPFPFQGAIERADELNGAERTFPCRCAEPGGREACMARYHIAKMEKIRSCRQCGCTDLHACSEGCYWVEQDLCSECHPDHKGKAAALAVLRELGDDSEF